jgi:transcriptional regulator with XRE-family HTH domain
MKTETKPVGLMQRARRRKGLTQLELARRVGCSESKITKIETGRAAADADLKAAIARELEIATWEVGV